MTYKPKSLVEIAALIALSFAMLSVFQFPFELKLTFDSYDYLSASGGFEKYFFGVNSAGSTHLHRPPVYPFFLSFFDNKLTSAWLLNFVSLSGTLILSFFLVRSSFGRWLSLWTCMVILFSYPYLQNHFFVWTEPLFVVFLMGIATALIKDKSPLFVLFCLLMCYFVRRAGLFVAVGVIVFYISEYKYKEAFFIAVSIGVAMFLWELLTLYLSDYSGNYAIVSSMGFLSRKFYADAISGWYLPRVIPLTLRVSILVIISAVFSFYFWRDLKKFFQRREIKIVALIAFGYIISFIVMVGSPDFHEADRYMSVVIPLLVILQYTFVVYLKEVKAIPSKMVMPIVAITSIYPVVRTLSHMFFGN